MESRHEFLAQLKAEFDQLYSEGTRKRRMMSISLHDRIGGIPAIVKVMDDFIQYAKEHEGVIFMRKNEIAKLVKGDPKTPVDNSEESITIKKLHIICSFQVCSREKDLIQGHICFYRHF